MEKNVLILKFVGVDDFSCPTYKDQNGHLWKDTDLGRSAKPALYSVTGNELDGEPCFPIHQEYTFDPEPFRRSPYEFQYMLLSRMRSDCEYYLSHGNRSAAILNNDPRHHIDRMKELWKEFPEDGKPEWLTWEQILQYENAICH